MAKTRVLIVDDDDVMRERLAEILTRSGCAVYQLPSAIGVTRAVVQDRIEVVVLDVMMPSIPGDKLAALLRQNPRFKTLGVVLISGHPAAELSALAREVGADGVVTKADATSMLLSVVQQAAQKRLQPRL